MAWKDSDVRRLSCGEVETRGEEEEGGAGGDGRNATAFKTSVTEVMVRLWSVERERGLHSVTGLQIACGLWICQQKYSEGDKNTLWARPITVHTCHQRGDTKVQLGRAAGGRRTWVATAHE